MILNKFESILLELSRAEDSELYKFDLLRVLGM